MAGYHTFRPSMFDSQPAIAKKVSATAYTGEGGGGGKVLLYRYGESNSYREGFFVGNRIWYKYVPKVGKISDSADAKIRGGRVSHQFRGEEILNRFIPDLKRRMEQGVHMIIQPDRVPSPSEQSLGGSVMQKQIHAKPGEAQAVDIKTIGGEDYQVTFSRLDDIDHHGIYGAAGRRLNLDVRRLRQKYEKSGRSKRGMYQRMANKGLKYFQNRLQIWNAQMATIQRRFPTHSQDAAGLRGTLHYASMLGKKFGGTGDYGFALDQASSQQFRMMRGRPTGFFSNNAGTITRTALGNMKEFGRGVTYTFQLDKYAYTQISKFRMLQRPKIRWDTAALNKAIYVTGHDALLGLLASDSASLDQQGVAMRQFHAQIAYETSRTTDSTETMTMQNQITSNMASKTGRIYPSIDMVQADDDFALYVRDTFVPAIESEFKRNSRNFSSKLGEKREVRVDDYKMWALPYISVADYDIRRHGIP